MSSPVSITIIVEDCVPGPVLMAEHGLAVWIDTGARCILFDAGQSRLILANAGELKLDLDAVDTIALSHGHYDHCGGLADVLANAADSRCMRLLAECICVRPWVNGLPGQ